MRDDNSHYLAVKEYYGERRAARSGVLYIRHIDEGLKVLGAIGVGEVACEAYCLHPIVQDDAALALAFAPGSVLRKYAISAESLAVAMEYRSVANAYLSTREIGAIAEIRLSPLPAVQEMLIADKVQNRKDFERWHQATHPRSDALIRYFKNWLERLGVSEARYLELARIIIDA